MMKILKQLQFHFLFAHLSLLKCEFDSFTFKLLYCVIFMSIRIKLVQLNCIYKTFMVPCENLKTVSFASSRMKYNLVFPALSKFAVKFIC